MVSSIATLPKKITFTLNIYALSDDDSMGIRIMKLRNSKNLTSKELGKKIGITGAGILGNENGNVYPSRDVLLKLVEVLGNDVLCDDYSRFITTEYGLIIKQWRIEHNFTCSEASNYLGIPLRTLYSLENMEYIISRKNFEQLKTKLKTIISTEFSSS